MLNLFKNILWCNKDNVFTKQRHKAPLLWQWEYKPLFGNDVVSNLKEPNESNDLSL